MRPVLAECLEVVVVGAGGEVPHDVWPGWSIDQGAGVAAAVDDSVVGPQSRAALLALC